MFISHLEQSRPNNTAKIIYFFLEKLKLAEMLIERILENDDIVEMNEEFPPAVICQ